MKPVPMFHHLKKAPKGSEFQSDEDVKTIFVHWFQEQPSEFFAERINLQMHQCHSGHGDCFQQHLFLCPEQYLNKFHLNYLHTYQYVLVQHNFTQVYIRLQSILFTLLRISRDVTGRKISSSYSSLNQLFGDEMYYVLAGKTGTGLLLYYFFRTLHCFSRDIIQVIVEALIDCIFCRNVSISIFAKYKQNQRERCHTHDQETFFHILIILIH